MQSAHLNAVAMCAVSFWGLQPLCRRLCMFLQSHDAIVPDTHTTVSHDEPTSDGPFPSVSLSFYQLSLSLRVLLEDIIFHLEVGLYGGLVYIET